MTSWFGPRLRTVAAAALLALVAAPAAPAGPAVAADGRCAPGTGVTVVVDYGPLGGGVVIGCDPDGAGKSASQVVQGAGFSLAYVSSQPGFVCRVNGRPTEDEGEDCGDTPPADAYWGLFWSDADPATWVYSSEGVGSLDVPEGGSIGWRFQDGGTRENPSAAPTPAKQTPSPQPSKTPSPQPSKPPKAADPTPTPSASVPPGSGGTSPTADAEPEAPAEQSPGGQEGSGSRRDRDNTGGGDKTNERAKDAKDAKGDKGDKGEKERKKRQQAKAERALDAEPSESPTVAALEPASDAPMSDDESSMALTLVAGAAVLALGGSAGVIAWRRRG